MYYSSKANDKGYFKASSLDSRKENPRSPTSNSIVCWSLIRRRIDGVLTVTVVVTRRAERNSQDRLKFSVACFIKASTAPPLRYAEVDKCFILWEGDGPGWSLYSDFTIIPEQTGQMMLLPLGQTRERDHFGHRTMQGLPGKSIGRNSYERVSFVAFEGSRPKSYFTD